MKTFPALAFVFCVSAFSLGWSQSSQVVGGRTQHLSFHPRGPVGLFRLISPERVESGPTSLGMGVWASYLRLDDFPVSGTQTRRLSGGAALSWTPGVDLEIFASGSGLTTNQTATQGSIQQVGNAGFGAKWAHDFGDLFSLGALYEGDLRQPLYDRDLKARALSHTASLIAALRFDFPLKVLVNAGYRVDDTDDLVYAGQPERERIVLETLGRDAIVGGVGVEVPLSRLNLSLEYSTEQSVDTPGVGYFGHPQRLTAGLRYFPENNPHWAFGLAGNVGAIATREAARIYKEPRYSFLASMTYFVGKPTETQIVSPNPVPPAKTGILIATIKDAKSAKPVGGAKVYLCGSSISPLVTDDDNGLIKSYELPRGECEIRVEHPDFSPYAAKIQIVGPDTTEEVSLERTGPAQGFLSLSVKDTDDRPLLAQVSFPEIPTARPVATSELGKIRLKLPEGKYLVEVSAAGKKPEQKIFEIVGQSEVSGDYVLAAGSARLENQRIVITRQVQFAPGQAVLREESKLVLDEVASILKQNLQIQRLEIGGHTDAVGAALANKRLSLRRAQSVLGYLVSVGVDRRRLVAVGYGQEKPIANNATPEGRIANRRVEFRVISK